VEGEVGLTPTGLTSRTSASRSKRRSRRRGDGKLAQSLNSDICVFRLPPEQLPLQAAHEASHDQNPRGENRHAGEYAGRIEGSFALTDEISDSSRGSKILPHDDGDDRHPDADMQAGEDPRQRARDEHMPHQLSVRGSEHPRIVDHGAIDLTDAAVRVEE